MFLCLCSSNVACSQRRLMDLCGVQMLANIGNCLAHMHKAGFVHRDLKPSNVMWLPRENRWTVMDFGCVAQVGVPAHIYFSLRYTAPEVIQVSAAPLASLPGWKSVVPSVCSWRAMSVLVVQLDVLCRNICSMAGGGGGEACHYANSHVHLFHCLQQHDTLQGHGMEGVRHHVQLM
jgi:serine/threonine protein kinase